VENDRIAKLRQMLDRSPDDARVRFGLAAEYERERRWEDVVEQLTAYLSMTDDEGNAWGRLAHALHELGREEEACTALRHGIAQAGRHGHPSMAQEFEERLEEWLDAGAG
jgi:predicted Zn-dependent protease